ncbi:hypothetical protein CJ030_MR7G024837 [Morella rubra]|uniref:Uncharacterized protein n=1 Tax=Morella rubra TaxID=262757 RepID=A0A6A1V4R0_9ROSI|nr:hypothetical protein CJ030_MR7G024837 [Morella rubra]
MVRASWEWAMRADAFIDRGIKAWFNFMLAPRNLPADRREEWNELMLYVAVVADLIWYTRITVTHQNGKIDLAEVGAIIRRRYDEHKLAWEWKWNGRKSVQWEPPPCSTIKVNFDGVNRVGPDDIVRCDL